MLNVVWFKRDLRIHDHAALLEAHKSGTVLPLHIVEPELWRQPDMSSRQWNFVSECLTELRHDLAELGQRMSCLKRFLSKIGFHVTSPPRRLFTKCSAVFRRKLLN